MTLQTPLKDLGLKYKTQARKLEKLGIITVEDLLYHIPARYEDLSIVSKIAILQPGETVTIQGIVVDVKNVYTRRSFNLQKVLVTDDTGSLECIWFNQSFITKIIHVGDTVSIAGRVEPGMTLMVKQYEVLRQNNTATHTARLVPIYPETAGLTSKWLRNRILELFNSYKFQIQEFLPDEIIKENKLLPEIDAIEKIHYPKNSQDSERARIRLSFDELFLTQLGALKRRREWKEKTVTNAFNTASNLLKVNEFIKKLPFELTNAQKNALESIFSDLSKTQPMNRLLEGDVGSGKTVVAAIALYMAYLNGFKGAYMAPTSILAQQHYQTISKFLSPFGVTVGLILGGQKGKALSFGGTQDKSIKDKEKNKLNPSPLTLHPDILIGTHALLSEKVKFDKLALVVIDEQQRFGVEQRAILRDKGVNPHFLTMTATPIPRTIFLTLYGDLDASFLNEMPKGRQKIITWLVPNIKREAAYGWIKKQIGDNSHINVTMKQLNNKSPLNQIKPTEILSTQKNQVFIVCPFIEESESMQTVKAATVEFERLKKEIFPDFRLGLLHGKMKASEKNAILTDFRNQKLDILVTTPVVEVGVDIPNATIMLIEGAERFGLAQLHQLRGRVGRSDKQSYCLLFTESTSDETTYRLKSLETHHIGAELAELDLKLRGPGEIYGTRQHGVPFLKIASFSNFDLIQTTRYAAEKIVDRLESYPLLRKKLESAIITKVSPD